jgi:azurin
MILIAACVAAACLAGCGKKQSSAENNAQKADSATSAPAPTPASGRQVEITGNDTMKFSVTEIHAKPGESLSVTLSNVGTMPKFSMGHNFVLLKQKVDLEAFVGDAAQAATTNYVPQSRSNDIIAHTKLLGPKEKDTVTFQAPAVPGRYPYLCSFPGHFQVGMRGELIVE